MNTYTQEELIKDAIERAKLLTPDFKSLDPAKVEKAAKEHLETGKDWVDGICFDLSYND